MDSQKIESILRFRDALDKSLRKRFMQSLILASSSPYRREILDKLGLDYSCANPNIDESPELEESIPDLVKRLAEQKALAVADKFPTSLIIGSDQAASLHGHILGKPLTADKAFAQLKAASGQQVTFYTGLAVYNASNQTMLSDAIPFTVHFRPLTDQQITSYIEKEQPLNCAGSFKAEGLGIALFSKLEGDDPNTLIGLPLIKLIDFLEAQQLSVL